MWVCDSLSDQRSPSSAGSCLCPTAQHQAHRSPEGGPGLTEVPANDPELNHVITQPPLTCTRELTGGGFYSSPRDTTPLHV